MRFDAVKTGSRFVFFDEGGLWRKTGPAAATIVHGRVSDKGVIGIAPDAEVYAFVGMADKEPVAASPVAGPVVPTKNGFTIVFVDDNEHELFSIVDATPQQIAAYAYTELIAITLPGKKGQRILTIDESGVEHDSQSLVLRVRDVTESRMPKEDSNGRH